VKRILTIVYLVATATISVAAFQQPPNVSGFEPVSTLPAAEQLPAAPLLITAYAFVWIAVMFYLWTIWRRLNKVEADLDALARKTPQR
jgi:CcmD family protein